MYIERKEEKKKKSAKSEKDKKEVVNTVVFNVLKFTLEFNVVVLFERSTAVSRTDATHFDLGFLVFLL